MDPTMHFTPRSIQRAVMATPGTTVGGAAEMARVRCDAPIRPRMPWSFAFRRTLAAAA